MIKPYLTLFLIIGLTAVLQKGSAQLIYFSDSFGKMFTVDISSGTCEVTLLGDMMDTNGFGFTPTDLAFHPNGKLYGTTGGGLYEINITTLVATLIGAHNAPGANNVNSLVCDSDGVMYAADMNLFTVNITNGNLTNLGELPCESSGDLAFNNNELYLACQGNNLLKINLNNPPASEIIGTMNANSPFFGIVTFATECSDVQTFGTAGNGLYEITIENAGTNFMCTLNGANEVYGAAMETDFIASDCEYVIDLDGDNSSGALVYDYFIDTCQAEVLPIADFDYDVIAQGDIDSMVIDIAAGILDGANEFLILDQAVNMDVFGSGTSHLTLVGTGGVMPIDIAHVLERATYNNPANPPTPGVREVTVQLFGENDNQSDIATAFINILAPEPFSIDIGEDTTLCGGETVILDATYENAVSYEWSDGSANATLAVVNSGVYTVVVTDDCNTTATDDIFVNFIPPVDILDLGPDLILCPGDMLTLDATLVDGTAYQWEDGSSDPMLEVTETGLYAVTVTASCGLQTADVFIEFQEIPDFSILPADTLLCEGETLLLDATLPNALAYNWQDGSTEPTLTVSESGIYEVTVNLQCGDYVDDILVTYNDYDLVVDLGTDTTFCFGDSVVLGIGSPYELNYLWQDGTTTETFVVNATGMYSLTVSDACESLSDEVFLEMVSCCNVFVPNVFSPDFDGTNDEFKAFSNCDLPVFDLKVFNRWGAVVFQTNDQYIGWDGQIKGKDGTQGAYVWLLKYNDGVDNQTIAGSVTLVR